MESLHDDATDPEDVVVRLQRVCVATQAGLGMTSAVVLLRSGSESETLAAASGQAGADAAELEYSLGEGPSRDAVRLGRPVLHGDLDHDPAWVAFAPALAATGLRSVFAFPLQMGAARFGALTMYGRDRQTLDPRRTARCLAMAELTTRIILLSTASGPDGGLADALDQAMALRVEIFQAQGMVMVALRTDLATALARMRAHAYETDRSLHEVSLDIVDGRLTLTDERPGS
ncbi:ANTAR domain-containing protein [Nocardioides exalbidus]|uniref:ANTAR domain-containing protein n=1 Tax=Nocardioides exalbidus TaxID=402596 RepID=A0A1H4WEX6_9ACTN|nr:GAF and ANTAR domain-containing protein [Nocardioides exalbidus]SEC91114.1 ANTAR domain-containing protein [Nocardioides exalbidus]